MKEYKSCIIGGYSLAYNRKGNGEVVLLVHGITTWSFIFENIFHELSKNYDVISLDLLGCGRSDKPANEDLSLKNHAALIKIFVDTIGLNKFHFVGHDLGGGIGQIFTVNNSERVLSLSLINSVAYDFWPVQPIITMRTPIVRQLAMASLEMGMFKLIVKRGLFHKDKLTPELMNQFWSPMKTKEGRKAFLQFAHCLDNKHLLEISDNLVSLRTPVLIIRGDSDVYLSSSIAEKLHHEIRGSKLERISSAGHFLMIDEPNWLIEKLQSFFYESSKK